MTPKQIFLVKTSFTKIAPSSDSIAHLFYGRLFAVEPSLRTMFIHDLTGQGQKFMATLTFVVNNLDTPENIMMRIQNLGQAHVRYGVLPHHYDLLREVLLWTLAQGLGGAFTTEAREAWDEAYTFLSNTMQENLIPV